MPRPRKSPPVFEKITYTLIGMGYVIHKELGSAHKEHVNQKALEEELKMYGIGYIREPHLQAKFKDKPVGVYVPDFLIDGKVIIELKALSDLPLSSGTQLNYYLKTTGYRVGLLLNFGARPLQIRRRIYG